MQKLEMIDPKFKAMIKWEDVIQEEHIDGIWGTAVFSFLA